MWYKDSFEIFSSRRLRVTVENDTSSLVVHQTAFTDEGEYKCAATNRAGHIITRAKLRLEGMAVLFQLNFPAVQDGNWTICFQLCGLFRANRKHDSGVERNAYRILVGKHRKTTTCKI